MIRPLTELPSLARGANVSPARTPRSTTGQAEPAAFRTLMSASAATSDAATTLSSPASSPAATKSSVPAVVDPVPTAESVFGANPWMTNTSGSTPLGQSYGFNSLYFATDTTAEKVAQLLGGKVVQENALCGDNGVFLQQQKNNMIELPNGRIVNAGLIANFYNHGYTQSYIDTLIQHELSVPAEKSA